MICTKKNGFTLVELMIVLVIVVTLAAMAIAAYQKHFIRAARIDAQVQMMDIANRQEQFLTADRAYVNKAALEDAGYRLPDAISAKYTYTVTLGSGPVPSYLITFTPYANQLSDGELTLSSEGVKTPANKW